MANYTFTLPDIGEGIAEAEIVAWHVAVGDMVDEDTPLADMMTDKATVEMTTPISGRIVTLAGEVGEMIAIGATLAVIAVEKEEAVLGPPPPRESQTIPEASGKLPIASKESGHQRVLASPAVRERARDLGIDLAEVETGGEDRVRHAHLDAFLRYNAREGYAAPPAPRADEQVKVIGLRRRIAENMAAAKRHIPHFTYVEEIDVTKLEELRADLNATRGTKPGLTVLPLLITAICRALPDFPMINARYDDEAGVVTRHGAVHLGVATQTAAGLMVPVIAHAEQRNIWQLATEIASLADAARSGTVTAQQLSGSTLTITSLGAFGGIATTPVINRPKVAIIGPNRIVERPVFRNGQVAAAKLMNLSISCDHRVIDGWDAANYVQALKRLLETPALLFA